MCGQGLRHPAFFRGAYSGGTMRSKFLGALAALAVLAVAGAGAVGTASATTTNVVVKPSTLDPATGWYFWNDRDDTFTGSPGSLVAGAAGQPLGTGSARLGPLAAGTTAAAGQSVIATNAYHGTPLTSITAFSYSSFQPAGTFAATL